jgi:hypothetical protein
MGNGILPHADQTPDFRSIGHIFTALPPDFGLPTVALSALVQPLSAPEAVAESSGSVSRGAGKFTFTAAKASVELTDTIRPKSTQKLVRLTEDYYGDFHRSWHNSTSLTGDILIVFDARLQCGRFQYWRWQ